MLTPSEARSFLDYNSDTGHLTWKVGRATGRSSGIRHHTGYLMVSINRKMYLAHRVIWLWVHGEWPPSPFVIDHINGNGFDNRLANLRLATHGQNSANAKRQSNNTSGYKGVCWYRQTNRWMASITVGRKSIHLGYFHKIEDAYAAYCKAALNLRGEFARLA